MRAAILGLAVALAAVWPLRAQTPAAQTPTAKAPASQPWASQAPPAPFEVVQNDVDLEATPDGMSWQVSEYHVRPLTQQGLQAITESTLSYTADYQTLDATAYTLKKDGRRIDVPESAILKGAGETSAPGFSDVKTITIVFPNLEIGDQAVLITRTSQIIPWFKGVFANTTVFPRDVVVREASLAFTSRGEDSAFHITASGVEAGTPLTAGGKTRRVWHYHNDTVHQPEPGAVDDLQALPRVEITTLSDYGQVAKLYDGLFSGKTKVTPEISALADKLTAGVRDKREQARLLYEWVAANIRYVDIVLGAGGFIPHEAGDVLKNGYGDCKDHVMLLTALLAAKDIKSSAVLINAGGSQYRLPDGPSPFLFDHLINYLPDFKLYVDSTARYAPFDVLPGSDVGKPVVLVGIGAAAIPAEKATGLGVSADTRITLNSDGSADGDTTVTTTGSSSVTSRALLASLAPEHDSELFRAVLGADSDGRLERGDPARLGKDFSFSAHYHVGHAALFPGPGALAPSSLGFHPVGFTQLIGTLPPTRSQDYVCQSGQYSDTRTIILPKGIGITALPPSQSISAPGAVMTAEYTRVSPDTVKTHFLLKLDRPSPVCSGADYDKVRPGLSRMIGSLLAQILYQ